MYVRGYLQGSENGRVVTIDHSLSRVVVPATLRTTTLDREWYLTCKIFLSATCTLDEPDKHFSHKLLLYFAFFVKWVNSLTYLRNAKSL
jgi:hypothetical protein